MGRNLIDRLRGTAGYVARAQDHLNAVFGPNTARIEEVLKHGTDALVMRGQFQGQGAAFKWFLTDRAAETVQRMEQELGFLSEHLGVGLYRVNGLLAALPDPGLAVLEWAKGERVSLILKSDDAARRAQVLRLCGGWLAEVAPLRQELRRLGPHRLNRQVADLRFDHMIPQDRALAQDLLRGLQRFAEGFEGVKAVHTIAHGDFAPVNMVSDGTTVTAVDIQGGTRFPLARMAARFLVAKDLYSRRDTARRWGLDADDMAQFAPETLLPAQEQATSFPYFIGQQMLHAVVQGYADRGCPVQTRQRLIACLTELEAP